MALVEWVEDYNQYKKGDQFELNGPSLDELLQSGKVKPAKRAAQATILGTSETATLPKVETIAVQRNPDTMQVEKSDPKGAQKEADKKK